MPFHYNIGSTNAPHCNVTRRAHVQLSTKIVQLARMSFWLHSP